jgi:hypothetical protein
LKNQKIGGEKTKKILVIFVCLLLMGTILAASTAVVAPKSDKPDKPGGGKPGGETPAGMIFFKYNDGTGTAVWTMKADGSEKTKLQVEAGLNHWYDSYTTTFGEISHLKHNDKFWFLRFEVINDEFYPDGLPRREAFVVSEDNSVKVQMTDDPTLAPNHRDIGVYWAPDDGFISWGAKKWILVNEEWVLDDTQAGVFTAQVNYDAGSGKITGAQTSSLIWWTELRLNTDGYWHPRTGHNHDWSPDGNAFCWQRGGIQVVDLVEEIETPIGGGYTPRWSPDGNKICFINIGIRTINPDGSDEQLIVEAENTRRTWKYVGNPRWSPDSLHISYNYREYNPTKNSNKIWLCRVEVSGGRVTKMTNDLPSEMSKGNIDWR